MQNNQMTDDELTHAYACSLTPPEGNPPVQKYDRWTKNKAEEELKEKERKEKEQKDQDKKK